MLKTKSIFIGLTASMALLSAPVFAQDDTAIETLNPATKPKKRMVRVVEAVPLWVDAERLVVRDNPYAGEPVGMLQMGQKVKIMEVADNWIRISSNGKPPKWVNSDFMSKTRVTWSNYEFGSSSRKLRNTAFDLDLQRIKIKGNKDIKIYAAHIKSDADGRRIVITHHDFRSGPYYEKRVVHCAGEKASHVRMLGEGYNYRMMEQDDRASAISEPISAKHAIDAETSALNQAIAEFTCEAKNI